MEIDKDILIDCMNTFPSTEGKVIFVEKIIVGIEYISVYATRYTSRISSLNIETVKNIDYMKYVVSLRKQKIKKILHEHRRT